VTDVHIAAFRDTATEGFAIVAINKTGAEVSLSLEFDGFNCSSLTPHRTSATEDLVQLPPVAAGSTSSVVLPGTSVTTYVGTALTDSTSTFPGDSRSGENGEPVLRMRHTRTESGMLEYELPRDAHVELVVHDSKGRVVRRFGEGYRRAGLHTVRWDVAQGDDRGPAPGMYFYRLRMHSDEGGVRECRGTNPPTSGARSLYCGYVTRSVLVRML